MHRWRRNTSGYFLAGSSLYFLLGVVILSSTRRFLGVLGTGYLWLIIAWLAVWGLRWIRKRREAKALEGARVELIPSQAAPGATVECVLRLNPPVSRTLRAWTATLVGLKVWEGEYELEGDRIGEVFSGERPYAPLTPNLPAQFTLSLRVPHGAAPTGKSDGVETSWSVRVCVRFAGSPEWCLEEPLKLMVLPPSDQG
jgi:hypothetical protein